jgi:hypothetical protein
MRIMRSRRQRVAAFIAASGGALALVGLAASTKGAYFTDVHAGQVDGAFGKVAVSVNGVAVQPGDSTSGPDNMAVHFSNMLPGQDKDRYLHSAQHRLGQRVHLAGFRQFQR